MTEHTGAERPLPPEGWYPDPEDGRYLRWWSGNQWELRKPVPQPGAVGRGFARLGALLGVLLVFNVLLAGARVALYVWGVSAVLDAVAAGDLDTATSFDDLERTLLAAQVVAVLPAGIVWMTWQHRLAGATAGLRRSPAMHAFSWIIPIGNLWLPFQNVRDLWRRILPLRGDRVVGWWWAGWICTAVIGRVLRAGGNEVDTLDELRTAMWGSLTVALLLLATVLLALRIVRSLNRGAQTSELVNRGGPPAA